MTQLLARTTTLLDGRKTVRMTGRVYLRAIVPIGLFFSLSLICGNITYLYLSVAFIQMLKVGRAGLVPSSSLFPLWHRYRVMLTAEPVAFQASTPVAVLLAGWALGTSKPNMKVLFNVSFIVVGVVIASFGEIKFVLVGFVFQIAGIVFEAVRLVMVQRLLSSAEYKMDPLVSLYYFAPVCAVMNGVLSLVFELPHLTMDHIWNVGVWNLLANAMVAFALNVSVVFLVRASHLGECRSGFPLQTFHHEADSKPTQIGKTSSLVLTLCGVLKDILLVAASMMIWATSVSALQMFGYSIALGGLVYYKLGADKLKEYLGQGGRVWAEYGAKHPVRRKLVIGATVAAVFLFTMGILGPHYGPRYDPKTYLTSYKYLGSFAGDKATDSNPAGAR